MPLPEARTWGGLGVLQVTTIIIYHLIPHVDEVPLLVLFASVNFGICRGSERRRREAMLDKAFLSPLHRAPMCVVRGWVWKEVEAF